MIIIDFEKKVHHRHALIALNIDISLERQSVFAGTIRTGSLRERGG